MGKKGTERHARRFQAAQQASSKFKQKSYTCDWAESDPDAIKKLITKVVK